MATIIYLLSTLILVIGMHNYKDRTNKVILALAILFVVTNGIDVFVKGNHTELRQYVYLAEALLISGFGLFKRLIK